MNASSSTLVSNKGGFTLLEILIAITILALMSLGVVSITDNAILTMDRTTEINKNNLQIETAMSRFEWDFSQIYSPLYFSTVKNLNQGNLGNTGLGTADPQNPVAPGTTGGQPAALAPEVQQYYENMVQRFQQNEHFMGVSQEGLPIPRLYSPEKNVFEFFTSSNRRKQENMRQSHFAWVRYALAPSEPKPEEDANPNAAAVPKGLQGLVRYYSADDPYDDKRLNIDDKTKVNAAVLLENVESLEFQFWNPQRLKWETNMRVVPQGDLIQRGVKIMIAWYDSVGVKRTAERIFRTNWPMTLPSDMNQTGAQPQGGVNAAATTGAQGGLQGTVQSGTQGGTAGGMPGGFQ